MAVKKTEKGVISGKILPIVCMLVLLGLITTAAWELLKSGHSEERSPDFVFRYAENQPSDYPTSQAAVYFANQVWERTNGRIQILVYTDARLGDEKNVVEQLKLGGIDFARVSISLLSDTSPALNVLQLPYLYKSSAQMWNVLEGDIGREFMDALDGTGLKGLSWYEAGSRSFYTTRPVRGLAELKGMRIRVQQSDLMCDMVRALGAEPVELPFADVSDAFRTGEIDGAENNMPSYEAQGHYRDAKYCTLDAHTMLPEMQLISTSTWKKLGVEDQRIIVECAKASAKYERGLWNTKEEEARVNVISGGATIFELSATEQEKFRSAVQGLYKKYCSEYTDTIEQIEMTPDTE